MCWSADPNARPTFSQIREFLVELKEKLGRRSYSGGSGVSFRSFLQRHIQIISATHRIVKRSRTYVGATALHRSFLTLSLVYRHLERATAVQRVLNQSLSALKQVDPSQPTRPSIHRLRTGMCSWLFTLLATLPGNHASLSIVVYVLMILLTDISSPLHRTTLVTIHRDIHLDTLRPAARAMFL